MFSSLGLFKKISCPEGPKCQLPVCIFLHSAAQDQVEPPVQPITNLKPISQSQEVEFEPPRKKQRNSDGTQPRGQTPERAQAPSSIKAPKANPATIIRAPQSVQRSKPTKLEQNNADKTRNLVARPATSSIKPKPENAADSKSIIVPSKPNAKAPQKPPRKELKVESLNPRLISKPPAAHAVRFKLVTLIHEQLIRVNELVKKSSDPFKDVLVLSPQALITLALDEEEQAAKTKASIYANVLKLRVVALKKLGLDEWKAERTKQIEKEDPNLVHKKKENQKPKVITHLTSEEEILLLPMLVTPQDGLEKFGYVTQVPSASGIEEARQGVEAAKGWERCDRCESRFQVFPGRREEDGALTSGGSCTYHWGRLQFPRKEKNEMSAAERENKTERYTCCRQPPGVPGCTTAATHVFKVSEPKRLALVMPFEKTPENADSKLKSASPICFDCEMGYTTRGFELIRLTAVSWPSHNLLLDVLVRPIGEVLDLNSRFSGVWPEMMASAIPHNSLDLPLIPPKQRTRIPQQGETSIPPQPLPIVPSPSYARSLLFKLLTPSTPLMGHALENDLNTVRVVHPTIIDTVLLYPHPRGLPVRNSLRVLCRTHINWEIQTGGERGHDSTEDAQAAGELIREAVRKKWAEMRREGWSVERGTFHAPRGK